MTTSRREFLKASTLTGAALLLNIFWDGKTGTVLAAGDKVSSDTVFQPSAWLRIEPTGKVMITVGKSEMGQGVRTSLPMILAEELEADWSQVELVQASPGPQFPHLETYGSQSTPTSWMPLRKAGATARDMLLEAAAQTWKVPKESCRAEKGFVVHTSSNRRLGFGELVETAAKLPVPKEPPLKDPKDFKLIGQRMKRVDGPRIVSGGAVYSSDIKVPGMRYAIVVRCPVFGGKAVSFNAEKAKAIPGVRRVVQISSGIAIVADSTWPALKAGEALEIKWDEGSYKDFSSESYFQDLQDAGRRPAQVVRQIGRMKKAMGTVSQKLEGTFEFPFLTHAPLEPVNCVVDVRKGECEIWAGTQDPNVAQERVAALLGIKPEAVTIHVTLLGGGFGRRIGMEFLLEAAEISKTVGEPVKLLWTRQDDIRHSMYFPASLNQLTAGIDAQGKLTALTQRITAPSVLSAWDEKERSTYISEVETLGAGNNPYNLPTLLVEYIETTTHLPISWMRGVQWNPNVFALESFIDEIAHATHQDPFQFRLELIGEPRKIKISESEAVDTGRLRKVLETAGGKADWNKPLPKGSGRGIACYSYESLSYVALAAEVSVLDDKHIKVNRLVVAIDCGQVVNPLGLEAQIEGGAIFGLCLALRYKITFKNGRVEQSSYRDYPVIRLNETPVIEAHVIPSQENPTGVGESVVPLVAPAVMNAVFAATGKRVRHLPLRAEDIF